MLPVEIFWSWKIFDWRRFWVKVNVSTTNWMSGFLFICMKMFTSALESALEQRVPLPGIARLRDHFQSKDHGRISQKIMFKKCSIMLCAFFKHSNHENLNFGSKSWISDIFWFFDKSELGYVVRKIHKESEFPVDFD